MDDSGRQPETTDPTGRLVRQVCTHVRCRQCGRAFARENVIVLGERERTWLVAVVCTVCHLQGLVFARRHPAPQPTRLTELSPDEAAYFALQPAISRKDVRRVCQALDMLEADISQLWQ